MTHGINMLSVLRFYVPNSADNYNYIVFCPNSLHAFAVDPFNAELVQEKLDLHGLQIVGILLTHEHADHTSGVTQLQTRHNIPVYGHSDIDHVTFPVLDDQKLPLGDGNITAIFTPGHTLKHFCFLGQDQLSPYLICADTIFNAGVGNTYSGDTDVLFATIKKLESLALDTKIYPAHDYMINNLDFLLSLEPGNNTATETKMQNRELAPDDREVTNWGKEHQINPFLRLNNNEIINNLNVDDRSELGVFRALRLLRNQW